MKTVNAKSVVVMILIIAALFALFSIRTQHNSKNTIRVLVDRLPHQLEKGQLVDIAAKRIMPLIDSGTYRVQYFDPQANLILSPTFPNKFEHAVPDLEFIFIQDEISRSLAFERGDAEATYNALNIEKTDWIVKNTKGTQVISADGFHLAFLGFNLTIPELHDVEVRKHIAMAIPVDEWAHGKWKDWVVPLKNLSFPKYDPENAKKFFKSHPLPILRFLTTSIREGFETAQMTKEALRKVGLNVEITIVETTLFYTRIRAGDYSIFSTRFMRTKENESIQVYLKTASEKNYFNYSNTEVDHFISTHPEASLHDLEPWIAKDLPFFPLYNWRHCLILSDRVHFRNRKTPVLDETFRFLLDLELK